MPGEIATYLLGAQGGTEDDFARLYEATNPVLVRYLRVTTDADPADVALATWSTVLGQLMACTPDDDAWLELVVGSARVAADGRLRGGDGGSASTHAAVADPDGVDRAIEALRACPPDEADVLAMGLVANLDRDVISRLTGHEPSAVLALVLAGQQRLEMSLEGLTAALRAPGRPDEVADLWLVSPLFTAALTGPAPTVASVASMAPTPTVLTAAITGTGGASPVAATPEPSIADRLGIESAAAGSSNVIHLSAGRSPRAAPSRSARTGAGVAAWVVGLGGVGAAAAMSGLLTAAVDAFLGGDTPPATTAQGPARPGTPSTDGGAGTGNPPAGPGTTPRAQPQDTGGGTSTPVSLPGGFGEIVVASFVIPDGSTPATPTGTSTGSPTTPAAPTTPGQPVAPQPGAGPVVTTGNGSTNGKAKARGHAKGKPAKAAAKARAAAKAIAKNKAKANGNGKALGHDKVKAKGKATGHSKVKGTKA